MREGGRWLGVWLCVGAAGAGCAFIDDFDKFDVSVEAGVDPDGGGPGGPDGGEVDAREPVVECADEVLGGPPVQWTVQTSQAGDDHAGSCGGEGAPEVVHQFTAPLDDFYRFHTNGSAFETVLYLRDEDCAGAELACSQEQDGPFRSEVLEPLAEDQRVMVIVDGRTGDSGEGELHVEAVTCPGIELTEAVLPVQHSTVGRPPYEEASCVVDEQGARTYRFTAREDGHYGFLAVGEEGFRPAVMVEKGPACGGASLQCNSGTDQRAEVFRYLAAGEHVTLIVAGHEGEGSFVLEVERHGDASCVDESVTIDDSGALDPAEPLSTELPSDGPHRMTTSCGNASGVGWQGAAEPYPDFNLAVDVPDPTFPGCVVSSCTVTLSAGFPFLASLSEMDGHGRCAGQELSCTQGEYDGDERYEAEISLDSDALDGVPKLISVDRVVGGQVGAINSELEVAFACATLCP